MSDEADVLLIEPFYGGSHRQLVDCLQAHLGQRCALYTLPAKKWHWRARTSSLYLSQSLPLIHRYKVLFASSVLNLAELVALRPDLAQLHKIVYFHENQLVYPVRGRRDRDFQYGYNQILSSLVADVVVFNSRYNMASFLASIRGHLKLMPDFRPRGLREKISPKCRVIYFPIQYPSLCRLDERGERDTLDMSDDCETSYNVSTNQFCKTDVANQRYTTNMAGDSETSTFTNVTTNQFCKANVATGISDLFVNAISDKYDTPCTVIASDGTCAKDINISEKNDLCRYVSSDETSDCNSTLRDAKNTSNSAIHETGVFNEIADVVETFQEFMSVSYNTTKGALASHVTANTITHSSSSRTTQPTDDCLPSAVVNRVDDHLKPAMRCHGTTPNDNCNVASAIHIVWCHRWEHDKNPESFIQALHTLSDEGHDFRVSVMGETFTDVPSIFEESKLKLSRHIHMWGYEPCKAAYYSTLRQADVVVSTAKHEFFGVAMLEAVHCGCYPLCPNRLVYPEIFPVEYLYNTDSQLVKRLRYFCRHPHVVRRHRIKVDTMQYSWEHLKPVYAELFDLS